jgi:Dolichyl-phosphate-mannose-protein mannosyltransferase
VVSAVSQVAPPAPGAVAAGATRRARGAPRAGWALGAVLLVQAGLSVRLVWTGTADQDEAGYLWAGHLEWAHWMHAAPVPDLGAYLPGAPAAYPLVGALADGAGGVGAARLLSLGLMLGVTVLLWATAARLYGRRAALLACALFATLAGTQLLGSLATADAPALLLLALATWLGVRAADAGRWARAALLAGCGLGLAAANVTEYATVLFVPVLVGVVLLAGRSRARGARALGAAMVLGAWAVPVGAAVVAGGQNYWPSVWAGALAYPAGDAAGPSVLRDAYVETSLILVLAGLGVWLSARRRGSQLAPARFLPVVLLAAALLVPAAQAGRHSTDGLAGHVVFGAWFAAIAAGYALARLSRVDRGYGWAAVMALPIAAATLFGSMGGAHALHRGWPDATALVRLLGPATHAHPGSYLADDDEVPAYYLQSQVRWQNWSGTRSFRYGGQPAGAASYAAAISRHHFALVVVDFGDTAAADAQITADLRRTGGYHVLARAGRFTVWAEGGGRHAGH